MADKKIELYSGDYFLACAIGGVLSCGLTHTAVVPLDLVKCRMQVDPKNYTGLISGFKRILSTSGVRAMALGWAPTLIGYSMQGANKFGFYEYFKYKYAGIIGEENAQNYKTTMYLCASASAEVIADVALCPWEAVKVRMQTLEGFPKTMRAGLPQIINAEGMGGLFKGLVPLWARQVPYTMMKFASFERTVEAIYKNVLSGKASDYNKAQQLVVSFLGGYIAGVFCAVVSHPADTVVSKLNNVKTEGSTGAAISKILKEAGPMGIWRGLGTRVIMIGTLTGLQWFIYDSFKVYVGLPTTGSQPVKK